MPSQQVPPPAPETWLRASAGLPVASVLAALAERPLTFDEVVAVVVAADPGNDCGRADLVVRGFDPNETSRRLPSSDRRAGARLVAEWTLADLRLAADADGRYALNGSPPMFTRRVRGRWRRELAVFVGQSEADRPIDHGFLERNPFDVSHGVWRHNLPYRTHGDDEVEQIQRSFDFRGWEPDQQILTDEHGNIIDGRLRALALEARGTSWRGPISESMTIGDVRPINKYHLVKCYGDGPRANAERVVDALLRNGRGLSARTRAAVGEAMGSAERTMPDIAVALGVSERSAQRLTEPVRRNRASAMREMARTLAAAGMTQARIGEEVARAFGRDRPVAQRTVADWLADLATLAESANPAPTLPPRPLRPPRPESIRRTNVLIEAATTGTITTPDAVSLTGWRHALRDARTTLGRAEMPGDFVATGEQRDGQPTYRFDPAATRSRQRPYVASTTPPASVASPAVCTCACPVHCPVTS